MFMRETFFLRKNFRARIFFFTENCKIMPELFQILNYAKIYVKEQFFMNILLKVSNYARSGRTVLTNNEELLLARSHDGNINFFAQCINITLVCQS